MAPRRDDFLFFFVIYFGRSLFMHFIYTGIKCHLTLITVLCTATIKLMSNECVDFDDSHVYSLAFFKIVDLCRLLYNQQ